MGGSDPNTAVLTAGNAAKNNVFCGELCIAAVVVAISTAYSAYAGGGKAVTLGVDAAKGASLPQPGVLTAIEKQAVKTGVTGNWSISGVGSAQFVETTTASVGKVTYRVQKKLDGYVIAIGPDGEKYVFGNHSLQGTSAGTLHTKWNERQFYEALKQGNEFLLNTKSPILKKRWEKIVYMLSNVARLIVNMNK
ncbi:hypothetical protein [Varunaivibrio sulfuroxidans]|uniref:Uncharacterized protein n=1 Tax=Varunaivibrio sulfuroxidans TaxID=1773489 RepID=A0A4R3J5Z0_9PROT|nr:hypothetical protein [Varunaivibrio sulfuroxidans]TCS59840.1 hypothetical protein EDD55_1162 [Varunaivibrio sulfuroxidans]WES32018.1 hypothetical protein P3M64_06590 [Varunaivibrio sulfuroxidans]